jgi:hypothetical protein
LQLEDSSLQARDRGSPQGSASSPVLANIFLHYALDMWLVREFPAVPFERYADDAILHCKSEQQARVVLDAIIERLAQVGLELNLAKTRIVCCKDADRAGSHEHERFTFLGYTFCPRRVRNRRGQFFVSFCPAVSDEAAKGIGRTIKRWRLALVEREDPRRPRARDQSDRAGVGQLLRTLLSVLAGPASRTDQPLPGAMGHAEIQAVAPPPDAGLELPGGRGSTRAGALCSPAGRGAALRPDDGSPVSREAHAGF